MKIPVDLRWKSCGKTIGGGGQGQIVAVTDSTGEFKGEWALKELKRNQPGQAYERFIREMEAIKKLNHPNIIKIVDHSNPGDSFQFYVMEYFEGTKTLEKMIADGSNQFYSEPILSLDLFESICEGLLYCESCSPAIVHRDLSPANILILPNNKPKLIDFGLCHIEGDQKITLVDEGVGTINYMAPECESGSSGERIAVGADLYSAGKILWTAITGLKVFSRENPVFNEKSMNDMFPENPETWQLHHIFEKTIRKNWRDRWGSARYAISTTRRIKHLIKCGYPSLEELQNTCPHCGYGSLEDFSGGHMVFGNPNPPGIFSAQCTYCGFCFAVNKKKVREYLAIRRQLE